MTSDAKIGLLLGLVFIFVIAFVINGLPGLRHTDDSNKLTTNMVGLQSNQPGLGANERKLVLEPVPSAAPAADNPQPTQTVAGSTDPRFTMALPANASAAAPAAGSPGPSTDILPTAPPLIEPAAVQPAGDNSIPPAQSQPAVATPAATSPKPTVTAAKPTAKPDAAKPAGPKVYVVEDGDTLSSIAKKVYGEQQGNKVATVNVLFEANRKALASADELTVGQKLVVPSLPAAAAPTPAPSSPISGPSFAKVGSVGARHLPAGTDKLAAAVKPGAPTKAESIYVVKEGDSLWRIAAERLGDGNRYKEIVKLNSAVLASEDDLEVGMQLKLPAR